MRKLWVQMLGLSVLITFVFSMLGLTLFNWITKPANQEARKNIYLFLANALESAPYPESMRMIERFRVESPTLASNLWVISADGHVYATNTSQPLPAEWKNIPKPRHPHELSARKKLLQLFPDMTLMQLNAPKPTYVLIKPRGNRPLKTVVHAQIAVFVLGLFGTASGGLGLTFLYLRKTSREAKNVMSRLHAGDLAARFDIRKMDEIGNLKLDFNAMADEIEQLLRRVQQTEAARKNLLRELGHDLRTPLTSLRASVETLITYREQMSADQQHEFLSVIQSELDYFMHLLEDLFFIADIAKPDYHGTMEAIDINALLNTEVQARQLAQPHLQWRFSRQAKTLKFAGDAHLLLRLLRNTLDNAGKYARSRIEIGTRDLGDRAEIVVVDDGPGISAQAIDAFGERKKHRVRQNPAALDVSLGLGSVIIKTIVELHGGELHIESRAIDPAIEGTRFSFWFPYSSKSNSVALS